MKKIIKLIFLFVIFFLTFEMIYNGKKVINSVETSILNCFSSIIPNLFPICFLSILAVKSGIITSFKKFTLIGVFILSQIGGYPIGAKILSMLLYENSINEKDFQRILPTVIGAGPSFIINVIGMGIFLNKKMGIILFTTQFITNFILFVVAGGLKIKTKDLYNKNKKTDIIPQSVNEASNSIILICFYTILFSAYIPIFNSLFGEKIGQKIISIIEITNGVFLSTNIYITCALLSFSGICVICQIVGICKNLKINIKYLIMTRIISAALSTIILKIFIHFFPQTISVSFDFSSQTVIKQSVNLPFSIILIFSVIVFISSVMQKVSGNVKKDFLY